MQGGGARQRDQDRIRPGYHGAPTRASGLEPARSRSTVRLAVPVQVTARACVPCTRSPRHQFASVAERSRTLPAPRDLLAPKAGQAVPVMAAPRVRLPVPPDLPSYHNAYYLHLSRVEA